MKSPKRRKTNENAQCNRTRLLAVAAFAFHNIFLQKPLQTLPPEIPVKNFLTLDSVGNDLFQNTGIEDKCRIFRCFNGLRMKGVEFGSFRAFKKNFYFCKNFDDVKKPSDCGITGES